MRPASTFSIIQLSNSRAVDSLVDFGDLEFLIQNHFCSSAHLCFLLIYFYIFLNYFTFIYIILR